MNTIPIIDYSEHPGFVGLGVQSDSGEQLLAQMHAIDDVLRQSKNDLEFTRDSKAAFQRIAQLLDETVQNTELCERTKLAVDNAAETMTAFCLWRSKQKTKKCRTPQAKEYLEQIQENGAAVLNFPQPVIEQLKEMLKDRMDETVKRHAMCPTDRCSLHMSTKGDAFQLAVKTLRQTGLTEAVTCMFGREAIPVYWYLAYNTSAESWYKNCYQDVDLPTSKFAYSHFDNDFDLAKIQIYFTDVGEDNGPFAFVPGSHQWAGCKTQQYIFKEMDRAFKYPKTEELYYRPRFGNPEYRKELMQLPTPFQGSSHLGDDIVEGTDLANQLDKDFRRVTSDQGNCCVFAGGDLLHYGGLVDGADRWVLQFGLAAERPHSAGPEPKTSFLRRMATNSRRYVGDKPIDTIRKLLGYSEEEDQPQQNQYTPNA